MANSDKDTIYVDIDDEITGIIDKVKASSNKVVALVLPKRASVFQSIVNMKLLKRATDASKKNLVLITSEAGLLPLAGAAGIHVAKTLTSRPEIPAAPQALEDLDEAVSEDEVITPEEAGELDQNKTVGELAGTGAAAPAAAADDVDTVTLDNTAEATPKDGAKEAAAVGAAGAAAEAAKPKNKKLKVPNFDRFRLILGLGVAGLILLVLLFLLLNSSLARATINISTDATNVDANLNLNLSTEANTLDPSTNTIPAKLDQQQKTTSQQVGTTGQKNEGNKASGTIVMTAQECAPNIGQPNDVPAGTGVSANNQTYITQQDASFSPKAGKGSCFDYQTDAIPIIAQNGGSSYNVSGVPFTVAGRSDVSANGSASGGTDNIVQVVNQNDINNAKSKISSANSNTIKEALNSQLQGEGYYPISPTFNTGTPNVTSSANVGDAASSITVTETITYTMFGVHKSDLKTLVDNSINSQIDPSKQSILDEGLSSASYNVGNQSATSAQIAMSTKAVAGPQLNVDSIKQAAEGKKAGDIRSQLMVNPDVTGVNVSFSPFWVSSAPKNTSKITVKIAKPTTTKSST